MPGKKQQSDNEIQQEQHEQPAPTSAVDGRYNEGYQPRYATAEELYSPEFLAELRARDEAIRNENAPAPATFNAGFAPYPPSGSPLNFHPEQTGWLLDLRDAAKTALASDAQDVDTLRGQVQALGGIVFELCRMIEHFDVKSDTRGRGH